jgi:hypothetical protein
MTLPSPRVPVSSFSTSFEQGPKRFLYDNACNMLAYMLNRDPAWASNININMQVFIDALHFKGPTGVVPLF